MKAIIIASGSSVKKEIFNEKYTLNDYLICADGGLNYLNSIGIIPNLIVGDFDSVDITLLEKYKGVNTKKFPPEKNFTDTEIAIEDNNYLAVIAEAKEVREFNNKMAARSRGGGGGGGRSSKDQADEDALNEFYRKASINEVLTDETLTDKQKASIMKVGLGVGDPSSLLSNYMVKPKAVTYDSKPTSLMSLLNNKSVEKYNPDYLTDIELDIKKYSKDKKSTSNKIQEELDAKFGKNANITKDDLDSLKNLPKDAVAAILNHIMETAPKPNRPQEGTIESGLLNIGDYYNNIDTNKANDYEYLKRKYNIK